jgi:hypothetical protein
MSAAYLKEIGESAQVAARRKVKLTIDANRAREAIGLEPIDAKAGPKLVGKAGLAK